MTHRGRLKDSKDTLILALAQEGTEKYFTVDYTQAKLKDEFSFTIYACQIQYQFLIT